MGRQLGASLVIARQPPRPSCTVFEPIEGFHADPVNNRRPGFHGHRDDRDRRSYERVVRFQDGYRRLIARDEWGVRQFVYLDWRDDRQHVNVGLIERSGGRNLVRFDILHCHFRFERRRRWWRRRWISGFQQFLDDRTRRDECPRPLARSPVGAGIVQRRQLGGWR